MGVSRLGGENVWRLGGENEDGAATEEAPSLEHPVSSAIRVRKRMGFIALTNILRGIRMPRCAVAYVTVALLLSACGKTPQPPPAREPSGILYVATEELRIHHRPADASPVVATFREGESVSIYSTRGDWVEVQLFNNRTGWARRSELTDAPDASVASSTPTFQRASNPVWTQKKVSGDIVFEASVNSDGDVISVRTISNGTGDDDLAAQNRAELLSARFHPLIQSGRPTSFVYEYRVSY